MSTKGTATDAAVSGLLSGSRRIFSSPRALVLPSPTPARIAFSAYPSREEGPPALLVDEHTAAARMASIVGRQFKDLLSVVHWNLSLLRPEVSPNNQGLVDDAASMIQAGLELEEALRFMADGGSEPWDARVNVGQIAHEVGVLARRAMDSRVRFDVRVQAKEPIVLGNANRLHQALVALAVNASEAAASASAPRVSIEIRETAQHSGLTTPHLLVSIVDNGAGMSEVVRERIGEPLFTTKSEKSIGLGYAIVGTVVREMGGVLDIASAPGEGTLVSLTFPRACPP